MPCKGSIDALQGGWQKKVVLVSIGRSGAKENIHVQVRRQQKIVLAQQGSGQSTEAISDVALLN
jgi:hypothetical protein